MSTPDGRVLRYCVYGPPDGRPVVANDGTPGTRWWGDRQIGAATRAGTRMLAYDRPGYGGSTRRPGRSIADCAADVALLADAQGWERFGVWGGSGGGPHALACAALLPDRVTRCAAVVSPAPFVPDGLDRPDGPGGADGPDGPDGPDGLDGLDGLAREHWLAGMSPGNVAEFTTALRGEAAYRPLVERLGREAVAADERDEVAIPSGYDLAESDLAELRRRRAEAPPGLAERTRAMWLDGVDGWVDDVLAMVRPWGVDLAAVRVPVTIWYGPDDVLCPRPHAEWLIAHVPGGQRRELPGGHALPDDSLVEVFRWVSG